VSFASVWFPLKGEALPAELGSGPGEGDDNDSVDLVAVVVMLPGRDDAGRAPPCEVPVTIEVVVTVFVTVTVETDLDTTVTVVVTVVTLAEAVVVAVVCEVVELEPDEVVEVNVVEDPEAPVERTKLP
jgi:hypothetical protein